MMALEIPGIYVRKDKGTFYVFDHVRVELVEKSDRRMVLSVYNPTAYDAVVTVLAEDQKEASVPLGDNAFVGWKDKVAVKAGATKRYTLKLK